MPPLPNSYQTLAASTPSTETEEDNAAEALDAALKK